MFCAGLPAVAVMLCFILGWLLLGFQARCVVFSHLCTFQLFDFNFTLVMLCSLGKYASGEWMHALLPSE